ncbi:MAG: hypothetical protein AB1765_00780 [Candidatus Hydrogenedentota bacterium]
MRLKFFLNNYFLNYLLNNNYSVQYSADNRSYEVSFCSDGGKKIVVKIMRTGFSKTLPELQSPIKIFNKYLKMYSLHQPAGNKMFEYITKQNIFIIKFNINIIDDTFCYFTRINRDGNKFTRILKTDYPIVDAIYYLFTETVNKAAEENNMHPVLSRKKNCLQIYLTHDVDIMNKNFGSLLRLAGINFYKFMTMGFKVKYLLEIFEYMIQKLNYDDFSVLYQIEQDYSSTFFLHPGYKNLTFYQKFINFLINPRYQLTEKTVEELKKRKKNIGLHSGYHSAKIKSLLEQECTRISSIAGQRVDVTRFHFLAFDTRITPGILEKNGITIDMSLYYNRHTGWYYHQTTLPYFLFDTSDFIQIQVVEIPTVLMDATLYNYYDLGYEEARNRSIELLENLKNFSSLCSINFHTESFVMRKEYIVGIYKNIIAWIKGNDVSVGEIEYFYEEIRPELKFI